jgi:2-amino-4-hydroxy-6-hydroxymethyldihydropteridine diphosphokinase
MAVYIALGANLGDRQANLAAALGLLPPLVQVEAVSRFYESPPQPPAPPPAYLNAACRVSTTLPPLDLLRYLKRIEVRLGRTERERWAPRPIDLDIALYDGQILYGEQLVVPHPRLLERAFVLQPLLDLDPELEHPATREKLSLALQRIGSEGLVVVAERGWEVLPDAQ